MNIFFLDPDPDTCAQLHCDKHNVKMILEYAQLLSTAHHVLDGDDAPPGIYKVTHRNHPSAVWVRESMQHYRWLHKLLDACCLDYTRRYQRTHKVEKSGLLFTLAPAPRNLDNHGWTDPPPVYAGSVQGTQRCHRLPAVLPWRQVQLCGVEARQYASLHVILMSHFYI